MSGRIGVYANRPMPMLAASAAAARSTRVQGAWPPTLAVPGVWPVAVVMVAVLRVGW